MAHEFARDATAWSIDEQFLWGSHLLIAPVIHENETTKHVYLPSSDRWFDYYTGEEQTKLGLINVAAEYDFIPLFVRGGAILARQQSAMNTVKARRTPMNLLLTLDRRDEAQGNLFWDDGDSIDTYRTSAYNYFHFVYRTRRLNIRHLTYKYPRMGEEIKLDAITIYGLRHQPRDIRWNDQHLSNTKWIYNASLSVLKMQALALNLSDTHRFTFSSAND